MSRILPATQAAIKSIPKPTLKSRIMRISKRLAFYSTFLIATCGFVVWHSMSRKPFLGATPRGGFDYRKVSYEKPTPKATAFVEFPETSFSALKHDVIDDPVLRQFAVGAVVEFRGSIAYDDLNDPPISTAIEIFELKSNGRRQYGSAGAGPCKVGIDRSEYSFQAPMPSKPGKYTYEFRCGHPSNLGKAKLLQRGYIQVGQ